MRHVLLKTHMFHACIALWSIEVFCVMFLGIDTQIFVNPYIGYFLTDDQLMDCHTLRYPNGLYPLFLLF